MIRNRRAASMVEYIVLVILLIGLVGVALWDLIGTVYSKLGTVYSDIGS